MPSRKQQLRDDIEARLRTAVDQFARALREELSVRPAAAIEDRTVIRLSAYRVDNRIETFGSTTELAMAISYVQLALDQFVTGAIASASRLDFIPLSKSLLGLEIAINQIRIAAQSYDADDQALLLEWRRRLLVLTADLHFVITQDEDRWTANAAAPAELASVSYLADRRVAS